MRKYIILIGLLITICCCDSEEKVEIVLNKKAISYGDTLIARFYINHHPSVAPEFHIIRNNDTLNLPPETLEYKNWIFMYIGRSEGTKEFEGYVDYLDIKSRKERRNFKFEFTVTN